ncbi:MAG: hypothetical protein FRX48_03055 [Lasallia pustulata]|uniref:Uncharacterized protein n=1 Tax=Lasallia pustulata TaxID=136370 RepID=A0A5M8PW55_9LECA|nr:MAG: hypothetical protein FRX48_03055 [Lasallia pustulata]
MIISSLSIFAILTLAINLISAEPLALSQVPRAQPCTNSPLPKARTRQSERGPLSHRGPGSLASPPLLTPRDRRNQILWCAPGTQTYVTVVMTIRASTSMLAERAFREALGMAAIQINAVIRLRGDGVIPSGRYEYDWGGLASFQTWNANNHQQTYGVVGAAISALRDFMGKYEYCAVDFEVWDGGIQVGEGRLANT